MLRLALSGYGYWGPNYARILNELAGCAEICPPALERARQRLPGIELSKDYRRLLDLKDVDAVVINTPDHWHALQTIHACEAGKDVYVEKPLSLVVAEGRAMVSAAQRNKRVVQVGLQRRSSKFIKEAADLVRGGAIGKVTVVRSSELMSLGEKITFDPSITSTSPAPDG